MVIELEAHRRQRVTQARPSCVAEPVEVFLDLADPRSYLAAERIERVLGSATWIPTLHPGLRADLHSSAVRARVQARAAELRLPLVWPQGQPTEVRAAMRVACLAIELGRGAELILAAARLAFCGGYSLQDPSVIAEAAAAAGLDPVASAQAAADSTYDPAMEAAGRWLREAGVDALPVVRVDGAVFCGESRLHEAAPAARWAAGAALP